MALDIVVESGGWDRSGAIEALARSAAEAAADAAASPDEALAATLLLADDETVRGLNRTWRGKDSATNVLSFPADMPPLPGEPRHLGDVALAYETLVREAEAEGKPLRDHVAHLVVHGVLHLLGQDHGTDAEAEAMERAETAVLATLGIADPYREPA